MNLNKRICSVIGVALSAATMLALGIAGVGSATAETTAVNLSTTTNRFGTIAVKNATPGHSYAVVQVGKYSHAATDGTQLTGISLDSTGVGSVDTAVGTAAHAVDSSAPNTGNVISWVGIHWLGFADSGNTNNSDATSNTAPYTGTLRDFVQQLDTTIRTSGYNFNPPVTASSSSPNPTVTFSHLLIGMYLVEDVTAMPSVGTPGHSDSIPMLVGTTIGENNTLNSVKLGEINDKTDTVTVDKSLIGGTAVNGAQLSYKITSEVPLWTGYTKYYFEIVDMPGAGLDLDASSVAIKIDNHDVGTDKYTVTKDETAGTNGGDDFHIVFTNNSIEDYTPGLQIVVTYKMTVNDSSKSLINQAKIVHSGKNTGTDCASDPTISGCTTETPLTDGSSSEAVSYSVTIRDFFNDGSAKTPTKGATFKVYDDTEDSAHAHPLTFKTDTAISATEGEYTYDTSTSSTDTVGAAAYDTLKIDGLKADNYSFVEETAPTNVLQSVKPSFKVEITDANVSGHPKDTKFVFHADIWDLASVDTENIVGSEPHSVADGGQVESTNFNVRIDNVDSVTNLPLTGGMGLLLLLMLGLLFGSAAVVFTVLHHRSVLNSKRI
ncbi:isopeptide-forming domain-containing fimbrial protein [Bifidobacterium sp. ESL0690]|uniref:isopeptide-forming domain-containing fimbrial protein n=1 Tax=Bifidobacterium sp. ESL0690 TaxID=2983214 RepID=UPI0023F9FDCE|nr:isopeptide-forming domain-containing fimbrial protein [Bifidobacterium sp. ESL0690]WEV47466.1 isopeptide-forming domain-containing fimbrial protein [Bifidobacterium sp. ESL0690]